MKYIRIFKEHSLYDASKGELEYPSLSYCEKENEVHYMPSNSVMFYVGDLSGKTDQTVVINYSGGTHDTVSIPEGNKWYSHSIPSGKTFKSVTNLGYIKEAVVNCDKAYVQEWNNVDKVSYYNCNILGGNFNSCSFTSLDVRTVDTSNVTDMNSMFYYCSGLKSLDLSGWDTSNVTDMHRMFNSCRSLTSLDVSNFNTSKVTSMSNMFSYCSGLASLDLSGWDTSNVIYMNGMFSGCSWLKSLDLSNFNTSNVTNMYGMFNGCSKLTSLDLSNFNTSNVTNMHSMFSYSTKLTSLDLSGWDMSKATDTTNMFEGCYALKTIKMVGCNQATIEKIKAVKPSSATIITE